MANDNRDIVNDDNKFTTSEVRQLKTILDHVPQDVIIAMARDYQSARVTFRLAIGFGSLITGILIFVGFDHVAHFVKQIVK